MTRTLTLKNRYEGNTTVVENDFIDNYIAKANGEYVKVFLMLLRHLNTNSNLSISGLADCLECTEKDILRAFKYWTKVGLMKIDYDEAGNICGLTIGKSSSCPETVTTPITLKPAEPALNVLETKPTPLSKTTTSVKTAKSATPKSADIHNQEALRQLYFMTEQYIGKPLSATEIKKLNYFFDTLNFSIDLIEYLVEYCVENGHRNFRYIESVAISWSDEGITTAEEAKMRSSAYSKNCYSIMNAFGIKGRAPAPAELIYIKKWNEEYCFSLDIILEACNRTITNTHKPDFKYTDTILKNWLSNGVKHMSDITQLDLTFQQEKTTKKRATTKAPANNRFNNFEGRSYDMTSLEQQLLNSN